MTEKINTTNKIKKSIGECGSPKIKDSSVSFPISETTTITLVNKGEIVVYINGKPITALVDPAALWEASEKMIKSLKANTIILVNKIDDCKNFKQTNSAVECKFDNKTILRAYRELGDEIFIYLNGNNINNIVLVDDVWKSIMKNLQAKDSFKFNSLQADLEKICAKEPLKGQHIKENVEKIFGKNRFS